MKKIILALVASLWIAPACAQQGTIAGQQLAGLGVGAWGITTVANGTGYVPGDTITPTLPGVTANSILGGAYNAAIFYVATTQVISATVAAGGSSCSGATATLTGTTGAGGAGAYFTATVPIVSNAISGTVTITSGGSYHTNPTTLTAEPVTGSSCSGAQLNIVMGVQYANIQNPGSYSSISSNSITATQASTSGTGTGATFTVSFAPWALSVPPFNSPNFGAQNVNSAAYNFCAGYECLNSVTSGQEDTAFGWSTLALMTTGQFNDAFGVHALGLLTTGSYNSAFGRDAGRNIITGTNNTFLGNAAGQGTSTGSATYNTAVGYTALNQISTGTGNVAVGSGAGAFITTSQNNVIIGNNAGIAANTGNGGNVLIGINAGNKITTGYSNIAIGPGVASATLTTGAYNLLIGTGTCDTGSGGTNYYTAICSGGGTIISNTGGNSPSTSATTIAGTLAVAGIASSAQADVVCTTSAGLLTYQVSATGCAVSSERFKEDIHPISNKQGLQVIAGLEPKTYHYRPETNMGDDVHFGFTAEQVEKIDPNLITREEDGRPHAVKYNELWPFLTAAIKELKAENDNLRTCNDNWKCRLFGIR